MTTTHAAALVAPFVAPLHEAVRRYEDEGCGNGDHFLTSPLYAPISEVQFNFDRLYRDRSTILDRVAPGARFEEEPVNFEGRRTQVTLPSGTRFRITFERMSLLAENGRAEVEPLVDKTGRFRFVLDRGGETLTDRKRVTTEAARSERIHPG